MSNLPPTLELYGETARRLHRPTLAAIGLWILVFQNLLSLVYFAVELTITYVPPAYIRTGALLLAILGLIRAVPSLAGFLLVALANLERNAFNPRPRRLMLLFACLAALFSLSQYIVRLRWLTLMMPSSSSLRFFYDTYWLAAMLTFLFAISTTGFSLIYLIQLARWLHSRSLAKAAFAVVVPVLFLDVVSLSFAALVVAGICGIHLSLSLPRKTVFWTYAALAVAAMLALIAFFTILAIRLHRAARSQKTNPGS